MKTNHIAQDQYPPALSTPSRTRRRLGISQGKKESFPQTSDYVREKLSRNKGKVTVQ